MKKIFLFLILTTGLSNFAFAKWCSGEEWNDCTDKFTYASGDYYVGQWMNNKPHGQGTYYFSTGESYNGQFFNGQYNGSGTYYDSNDNSLDGYWDNGKFAFKKKFKVALVGELSLIHI